jgi:NADPH:quinone reductase-like Zn-dependent oxidoreductase
MKELYQLGETPPLGEVPARMLAQLIRQERFGQPTKAFQTEQVEVPAELKPDEVLVWVMAAGINYNNVWAGLGSPVDVIKARQKDPYFPDQSPFHIGGSDASGVIWKVGSAVKNVKVGDQVVIIAACGARTIRCSRPAAIRCSGRASASGATRPTGELRAVHARAGAPVPAQAEASQLGRGRCLHAGRRDGISHARGVAAAHRAEG